MRSTFLSIATVASIFSTAVAQTAYANDWVDPDYILSRNFGPHTARSQAQIILWAHKLAIGGPWSVMNKTFTPPSGNKHDYMSLAPYWWPDCSGVGNATALTEQQIWTTCPYKQRDGQFNPDARTVDNVGGFQSMSEASFYNTMAWALNTDPYERGTFEFNAVRFIRAWFIDDDTKMTPHMNYAQMKRGPDGQLGSRTGILDLKNMVKVSNAILILRKGQSKLWTDDLDSKMRAWTKEYINWLETSDLAQEEKAATNNHGSFYYNQLAALKILNNDMTGAKTTTDEFFNTLYMDQITSKGEQPLEAIRTRPYHYRAYNLAALVTNARLAQHVDKTSNSWNKTTKDGANIKSAVDFAMTVPASGTGETKYASELHPIIASAASVYGDSDGKYLAYMKKENPLFMSSPYVLWNQPWAENEASGRAPTSSVPNTNQNNANGKTSGGVVSLKLLRVGLLKRMALATAAVGVLGRRL
ncbi:hypothetical protein CVT26_015092 [Gymnopilus dilepis]|uniref:Alginate lyase domain-containing protein n=1 Tax=Gymnopilus dilepis TaxID=231916 RepID=A0A409WS02_9AGAR|nr:hypothetical protein CVT26_015092 [Gymnopilus dilepis]